MTVDIGPGAIDRAAALTHDHIYIDLANPANHSGWITNLEIWAATNLVVAKVASYYDAGGGVFCCRDCVGLNSVPDGSKQTYNNVLLWVEAGDYLGVGHQAGAMEVDTSGGSGVYSFADTGGYAGSVPGVCFSPYLLANHAISLYGTGVEASIERFGEPLHDTGYKYGGATIVGLTPCVNTGRIKKIRIRKYADALYDLATFEIVGGLVSTVDYIENKSYDDPVSWSYQYFYVDLAINAGQYAGFYPRSGTVFRATSGGMGYKTKSGDYVPCAGASFSDVASYRWSMDALLEYGAGGGASPASKSPAIASKLIAGGLI